MRKLKKCPFCHSSASLISSRIEMEDFYGVKCDSCSAAVGFVTYDYDGLYLGMFNTEQKAIDAWNKRG